MDNITGFIVSVRTKGTTPVPYTSGNEEKFLQPTEELLGYFQSISLSAIGAHEGIGHIKETVPINRKRYRYYWGNDISFQTIDMHIEIKANRGSNPPPLGYEYLDTWHIQRATPTKRVNPWRNAKRNKFLRE